MLKLRRMSSEDSNTPRVLMFGWEFPPHNSGGLGVACYGLTRALTRTDVSVTFVLPKRVPIDGAPVDIAFASEGRQSKVDVHGVETLLTPYISSEQYQQIRSGIEPDASYAGSLYEEVERYGRRARLLASTMAGEIDVVHAHDWLSFKAGIAAADELGVPLIAHVHATEYDRTGGNGINQYVYEVEREGVQRADAVISVSNFTRENLLRHYGVSPDKVVPVHNGIDAEDYTPARTVSDKVVRLKEHGYNIVLFVGRLTLQKGPDHFVGAAKRILEYAPNTKFVIAGSGDMESQLIRDIAREGISDAFIFAGFVRGAPLAELYKAADLYIMPSVSEPFGITPLESLINGTPVLISKQSGVSEVLKNALTVDFWDQDAIVDRAVSVLTHRGLHETLRREGNREVYQHTWRAAAEKVRALYGTMQEQLRRS